jgi:hypothetical protein
MAQLEGNPELAKYGKLFKYTDTKQDIEEARALDLAKRKGEQDLLFDTDPRVLDFKTKLIEREAATRARYTPARKTLAEKKAELEQKAGIELKTDQEKARYRKLLDVDPEFLKQELKQFEQKEKIKAQYNPKSDTNAAPPEDVQRVLIKLNTYGTLDELDKAIISKEPLVWQKFVQDKEATLNKPPPVDKTSPEYSKWELEQYAAKKEIDNKYKTPEEPKLSWEEEKAQYEEKKVIDAKYKEPKESKLDTFQKKEDEKAKREESRMKNVQDKIGSFYDTNTNIPYDPKIYLPWADNKTKFEAANSGIWSAITSIWKGTMSEPDAKRIEDLIPEKTDTASQIQIKKQAMRKLLSTMQKAGKLSSEESSSNKSSDIGAAFQSRIKTR